MSADSKHGVRITDTSGAQCLISRSGKVTTPLAPTGPVYMYTSQTDEFAPLGPALRLAARYCAAGVTVDQVTAPPGEHAAELALGAPAALDYLADRFAGKPAPDTCPSGTR